MENIAHIITQPETVFIFVSIILLVALIPLYQAIISIGTVNRDLAAAIGVLGGLGKNQQDEFYNQFKTVNTQILRISGLRHAWKQFVDSMYFESSALPNAHKKVYLSHRPAHYFNRESVLGTRLHLSQFLAYPNYLIGIGLTFTFIGLAAALHVAQAGLASGAGQQALKELLAVASVKFISSIVGILSSLVISALQRVRIRLFQQQLDTFCDLLEECTKYKSTEKLLHDSLSEQKAQTLLQGEMGNTIAKGISEAISSVLSTSVTHALEPLTQEIRSLAHKFSEGSESALNKMITAFLAELHKTSAHEMQDLLNSVRVLEKSLDGLVTHIQTTGKDMGDDIKLSSNHLSEALRNVVTSLAPMQHSITQFSQSIHSIERMANTVEKAGSDMHSAADTNKKAALEFEHSIAGVSIAFAPIKELLAGLSQSLHKVEEVALNLRQAGSTITTAAEEFKSSALIIESSEDKFNQKIKTVETSTQKLLGAVSALESLSRQIDNAAVIVKKNGSSYFSRLKSRWLK